jgi:hypothetical protein
VAHAARSCRIGFEAGNRSRHIRREQPKCHEEVCPDCYLAGYFGHPSLEAPPCNGFDQLMGAEHNRHSRNRDLTAVLRVTERIDSGATDYKPGYEINLG